VQLSTDLASIQEFCHDGHSDLRAEMLTAVLFILNLGCPAGTVRLASLSGTAALFVLFPAAAGTGLVTSAFLRTDISFECFERRVH